MPTLTSLHIWTTSASYLLFGLAFATGTLYTHRYRLIKHKQLRLSDRFPLSINHLEGCLIIANISGFILLNLAIPTGIILQNCIIGHINVFSPRMIFPVFIWIYYLFIIVACKAAGIRGIRHANFTAIGFKLTCAAFAFEILLMSKRIVPE